MAHSAFSLSGGSFGKLRTLLLGPLSLRLLPCRSLLLSLCPDHVNVCSSNPCSTDPCPFVSNIALTHFLTLPGVLGPSSELGCLGPRKYHYSKHFQFVFWGIWVASIHFSFMMVSRVLGLNFLFYLPFVECLLWVRCFAKHS